MRKTSILIPVLIVLLTPIAYAACTLEVMPNDYENEKCASLKTIVLLVRNGSIPLEGANVTFSIDNNNYVLYYSTLQTNSSGLAQNKVLFGNYGNATVTYSAEYNSTSCGNGSIDLSIDVQILNGTVYETNDNTSVESGIMITHLYNGQVFYVDLINGTYSVELPVCNYIINTVQQDYHQVLIIEANMSKDTATEQDIPVTQELCNGADDDGDGSIDEDFFDSGYNNYGPKDTSCRATDGVCQGTYVCSADGYYTECDTEGFSCEFCYNIQTDPDDDYDVYQGECSYNGICMYKTRYYSSFYFNPLEKMECSVGCSPVSSDINATLSATCN